MMPTVVRSRRSAATAGSIDKCRAIPGDFRSYLKPFSCFLPGCSMRRYESILRVVASSVRPAPGQKKRMADMVSNMAVWPSPYLANAAL